MNKDKLLDKKIELMKEQNNKAFARIAYENWVKHIPVYGWMRINYPSTISIPLKEKYSQEKDLIRKSIEDLKNHINGSNLPPIKGSNENESSQNKDEKAEKDEPKASPPEGEKLPEVKTRIKKMKNRPDPDLINQKEIDLVSKIVKVDYTKNFLKNYIPSDNKFLKEQFRKYDYAKQGFNLKEAIPQNIEQLKADGALTDLYQLGIKRPETYLTTMDYKEKCEFIDNNYLVDKKYCTMFPKSAMLGPEQDENFTNKNKNRGDLSFEENKDDVENIKNLTRLPPENITEEWIKENLNKKVTLINFSNCYWLTKDLVSKLGRLDPNLISINLRCLDLSNYIVENILSYAKNCQELILSCCTGLTNGLLEILASKGKNLEKLNLLGLKECVDDKGLLVLGQNCLKLSEIILSNNSNITDKGIKGLTVEEIKFTSIDISYCPKITDEGLNCLIDKTFGSLTSLFINGLPLITSKSLENLKKCTLLTTIEIIGTGQKFNTSEYIETLDNLKVVDLSGCTNVQDKNLIDILSKNRNLKILRISNCTLVTNNFLEFITKDNTHLLLLEINRTPLITAQKIAEIEERMKPNLRIIRASNIVWSKKNLGLTVPYKSDNYVKPLFKGAKKPAKGKNDDKNPESQLMKLREEMKPQRIYEFFENKGKKKPAKKKK